MILQDPQTIRHYQKITDGMVELWRKRYSYEEIRLYLDGYVACLRSSNFVEQYLIHRLEEQALIFCEILPTLNWLLLKLKWKLIRIIISQHSTVNPITDKQK